MARLLLLGFVSLLAREVSAQSVDEIKFYQEQSKCVAPDQPESCSGKDDTCYRTFAKCCKGKDDPGDGEQGVCTPFADLPVIASGGVCSNSNEGPSCAGLCSAANGEVCVDSVCAKPAPPGPFFCACTSDADCNSGDKCLSLGTNRVKKWCFIGGRGDDSPDLPAEPSADTLEGDICNRHSLGDTCGYGFECRYSDDNWERCTATCETYTCTTTGVKSTREGVGADDFTCCEEALKPDGEACSFTNGEACQSGWCAGVTSDWWANPDDRKGVCRTPAVGASCYGDAGNIYSCMDSSCYKDNSCSLRCYNDVCVGKPVKGEFCSLQSVSVGQDCAAGFFCDEIDNTCKEQKAAGEGCSVDAECESVICQGSTCFVKKAAGEGCSDDAECEVGYCAFNVCTAPPVSEGACHYHGQRFDTNNYKDECIQGESCDNLDNTKTGVCKVLTTCNLNVECGSDEKCVRHSYVTNQGFCLSKGLAADGEICDGDRKECAIGLACLARPTGQGDATEWGVCGTFVSGDADGEACQIMADPVCDGPYHRPPNIDSCNDGFVCKVTGSSGFATRLECTASVDVGGAGGGAGDPGTAPAPGTGDDRPDLKSGDGGDDRLTEGETCTQIGGDGGCVSPFYCACVGDAGALQCSRVSSAISGTSDPLDSICAEQLTAKLDYIDTACEEGGTGDPRTKAQQACSAYTPSLKFDQKACYKGLDQDKLDEYDVKRACCYVCRHTNTLTTLSDLVVALKHEDDSIGALFDDYGSIVDCSAGTITKALELNDFCSDKGIPKDISDVFTNCPANLTPTQSPTSAPTDTPTVTPTKAPTQSPTSAPTDTPTVTPTKAPTPQAPTSAPIPTETRTKEISAILGVVTAPMQKAGEYILVPEAGNRAQKQASDVAAIFTVYAATSTTVKFECEVLMVNGFSNSFYVWFDGDIAGALTWATGISASFTWVPVDYIFTLSAGTHTFHVGLREEGAKLRTLRIISDDAVFTTGGSSSVSSSASWSSVWDWNPFITACPELGVLNLPTRCPDGPTQCIQDLTSVELEAVCVNFEDQGTQHTHCRTNHLAVQYLTKPCAKRPTDDTLVNGSPTISASILSFVGAFVVLLA